MPPRAWIVNDVKRNGYFWSARSAHGGEKATATVAQFANDAAGRVTGVAVAGV
jgi:hypothetical protein